jgi:high-affinity Fe2+/Pb2+ permease
MKIQDLGFVIFLISLLVSRNSRLAALAGLTCLVLSIPLFAFWIFFTAQRLVMYAAAFFVLSIIFQLIKIRRRIV